VSTGNTNAHEVELDKGSAGRAFGDAFFNLIRRGADGSLTLSADHWRLAEASSDALRFSAREADAPALVVDLTDVERVVWDRLPKQQARSQIRFFLSCGDVWTFSGGVDASVLPKR
jgi:hypothetical protein